MKMQDQTPVLVGNHRADKAVGHSPKRVKTAGIIGGLGPQATGLFYDVVNQVCLRKKLPVFPRLIINSVNPWAVTRILADRDMQALCRFLHQEAQLIQPQVDFVAMVCNSVHAVAEPLRRRLTVPLLSICEVVSRSVVRSGIKKVGIIGTKTTLNGSFYQQELSRQGVAFATLSTGQEAAIDALIFEEVLYRRQRSRMRRTLLESVRCLQRQGCEGVIMACTELPLFIRQEDVDIPLFLSTQLLAEAVVDYCIS